MQSTTKPIKILSVDDEPDMEELLVQKFRKEIKAGVYQFYFGRNGVEALDLLKKYPDIDFILSDINMPIMDGLRLLSEIKALNNPLLQTVMVTAYGDMANLRTAMNNGAFDFVNKPINFDDLEITMRKTIEHVNQLRKSFEERDMLVSIQKDLDVAKNIQLSLVPRKFPAFPDRKEIDIYADMIAAKTVGGDLYDFFFIDKNRLGIVIGDVAGKGIPGAIFMALSRTIIRTTALKGLSAAQCLFESNNLIEKESIDAMFVTVFYGILDVTTGVLEYANAGHCPPIIIKKNNTVEVPPKVNNMVLGIFEDSRYDNKSLTLDKNDVILLYTDGVTEAMNNSDEIYTEQRLKNLLTVSGIDDPKNIITKIEEDIYRHVQNAEQSDDITMLCVKFKGV